jgi:hypothetical protein
VTNGSGCGSGRPKKHRNIDCRLQETDSLLQGAVVFGVGTILSAALGRFKVLSNAAEINFYFSFSDQKLQFTFS